MIGGMFSITHDDTAATRPTAAESVIDLADRFGAVTLLAVWAHPDDESFLAGGLLAEVARRGGRVVTVTATAGEHGTDDPAAQPPAVLAARRVGELDAALEVLGGESAIHLGYADGGCDQVTDHLASHLVGRVIDRVQPDVILTFGPDGVTGHPDHQAVGRWVRRAVGERGDRIPLLTTAAADAWHDDGIDRLHSIDAFWPGFPQPVGEGVVVRLDDELLDRKLAAIACHASQMGPVFDALGPDHLRRVAGAECYVAANPAAVTATRRHLSPELEPIAA
jgi:LmbE family N-acetylglucosaminyl deacetylase